MNTNSWEKISRLLKTIQLKYWMIPIFVVTLTFIIDFRYYITPPIHSDDWSILLDQIQTRFQIVNFYDRRPLIDLPYYVLASLFGTNLFCHYLTNFIILFLIGCMVYFVTKKSFPNYSWLALPTALICIIYPLDFTKTWLVHVHAHLVLLIDLLVIYLLLAYKQNGKWWKLLVANILFIISLLIYEAGLGIVMMVAFLVIFDSGTSRVYKFRIITTTLITGIIYVVWRTHIQTSIFNLQDVYLEQFNMSLITIAHRYIYGFIYILYSWIRPIIQFLGSSKLTIVAATGLALIVLFIGSLPRIVKSAKTSDSFPWDHRVKVIKALSIIVLIGLLLWAAGYIPVIGLKGPTLDGNSTRNNLFAIAGASIMLVSSISSLVALKVKTYDEISKKTSLLIIPFVVIGVVYQIWSQNQRFNSWEDQKTIWNNVLEIAPALHENSKVGIIIPGYKDLAYFQILPFTWRWDARNATRILYNDQSLDAFYYYLERGIGPLNQIPEDTDWSKTLLIYVDPRNNYSYIISEPEKVLPLDRTIFGYNPEMIIAKTNNDSEIYRFLIE